MFRLGGKHTFKQISKNHKRVCFFLMRAFRNVVVRFSDLQRPMLENVRFCCGEKHCFENLSKNSMSVCLFFNVHISQCSYVVSRPSVTDVRKCAFRFSEKHISEHMSKNSRSACLFLMRICRHIVMRFPYSRGSCLKMFDSRRRGVHFRNMCENSRVGGASSLKLLSQPLLSYYRERGASSLELRLSFCGGGQCILFRASRKGCCIICKAACSLLHRRLLHPL